MCWHKKLESLWDWSCPFGANLFPHFFESKCIRNVFSLGSATAYKYQETGEFIDNLCPINDDNDFGNSCKYIYPKELELKIDYSGSLATFLDLYVIKKDGVVIYKLFDKRGAFPFFIVGVKM